MGKGLAAGWEGMYLALGGGNGSVGAWIPVCVCMGLVGVETGIVGRGLLSSVDRGRGQWFKFLTC